MDYNKIAADAMIKARDIARTHKALEISEAMNNAKAACSKSGRSYAKLVVDFAETMTKRAKEKNEIAARRDAYGVAIGNVPGLDVDTIAKINADITALHTETDAKIAKNDKMLQDEHAKDLEDAAKYIVDCQADLAKIAEDMVKLNAGEIKMNLDEIKDIAADIVDSEVSK
jgi:hypothetical protein